MAAKRPCDAVFHLSRSRNSRAFQVGRVLRTFVALKKEIDKKTGHDLGAEFEVWVV